MIVDQFGLIRAGSDGGDSLQRTYSFYLLVRLLAYPTGISPSLPPAVASLGIQTPWAAQALFEVQPGIYIRNPEPNVWYDDPSNVSRDQLTPVICFLATMSNSPTKQFRDAYRPILTRLLVACLKRGMFAQNIHANGADPKTAPWKLPDALLPDLWATFARGYVRSWAAPIAIPVILLGDLYSIFGSLFKCFVPINQDGTLNFRLPGPNDVDDTNLNNVIVASQYNWPTPLSWLARKIYKVFRRPNNGNTQFKETSNIMGAIAWYNRNDDPEMTELYRPLVERY